MGGYTPMLAYSGQDARTRHTRLLLNLVEGGTVQLPTAAAFFFSFFLVPGKKTNKFLESKTVVIAAARLDHTCPPTGVMDL
jgi:hypothetical protein